MKYAPLPEGFPKSAYDNAERFLPVLSPFGIGYDESETQEAFVKFVGGHDVAAGLDRIYKSTLGSKNQPLAFFKRAQRRYGIDQVIAYLDLQYYFNSKERTDE